VNASVTNRKIYTDARSHPSMPPTRCTSNRRLPNLPDVTCQKSSEHPGPHESISEFIFASGPFQYKGKRYDSWDAMNPLLKPRFVMTHWRFVQLPFSEGSGSSTGSSTDFAPLGDPWSVDPGSEPGTAHGPWPH
jgi:hypothetical protein